MVWLYLIGLVIMTMIVQIAILETNVRKLKKKLARLDSVVDALIDVECPELRGYEEIEARLYKED